MSRLHHDSLVLALALLLSAATASLGGEAPVPAGGQAAMAAKDDGLGRCGARAPAAGAAAGLTVLANHDPVSRNNRGGEPLRIGDKEFSRGLYCHAVSKVLVTLPSPGKSFSAIVGVDSNPDTRNGKSSVVFSVSIGDKVLFKSDVLRVNSPGVPVAVDLGGATRFTLDIGDAGDGIGWDQSDWADAKVVLADGKELWIGDLPILEAGGTTLPFSFKLGDLDGVALLADWPRKVESRALDANRTETTTRWTDPKTGLEVRWVTVDYRDFPTVEWTLHFKNTGAADSPVLSKIQALDVRLPRGNAGLPVLHYFEGGYCGPQAYKPHELVFSKENHEISLNPGGRGSDRWMPYFNLEIGDGGVILAIGWPGQWKFDTFEDKDNRQGVVAGQEATRFKLHPGEEARSPLIALQFWKGGDWIDAQNVWRRWMIAHNMPTRDGKPLPPQIAGCSSHLFNEMLGASEENQIQFVTRHVAEGLKLDYWWMDAGWYPNNGGWWNTGTWEVDTKRFPRGLRAISDVAHAKGVKTIVWFEPERVTKGTWLWDNHPDWLIGRDGNCRLLNLGNPDAWKWLVDHVDRTITEQGIDLYRQDYNINPLGIWRECDPPDRQGLTEIKYNVGYLAYWDELRRRHPGMLIDTCSSGGRRNDLETLRRSVPLLRSDDIGVPANAQGQTYGLAFWVPYWGTGSGTTSYVFRSNMGWHMTIGPDARRKEENYAEAVRLTTQWREAAVNYHGDYYPLTPYTFSEHAWMAFQFDRPGAKAGMVLAYRRAQAADAAQRFRLRGLDPAAQYEFKDADTGKLTSFTGEVLMQQGLPVELSKTSQAALITYRRAGP
jgi:alpha-galactosidase